MTTNAPPEPRALRFEAVIFDFSGTLFSAEGVISSAAVARRARSRGTEVNGAEAERMCRLILRAAGSVEGREILRGCDRSAEAHRAAWTELASRVTGATADFAEAYHDCLIDPAGWRPFAESRPTLEALAAAGLRIGVLSNIGWDVRLSFARAGLRALVHDFVLSWEHGVVKPEAEIFELACQRMSSPPDRTLMVGDDPICDGGAAHVGITTYLLPPAAMDPARQALLGVVRLTGGAAPRPAPEPQGPRRGAPASPRE